MSQTCQSSLTLDPTPLRVTLEGENLLRISRNEYVCIPRREYVLADSSALAQSLHYVALDELCVERILWLISQQGERALGQSHHEDHCALLAVR